MDGMAENTLEGLKAAYRAALQERDEARVDLALATTGAAPVGVYARLAAGEAERDTLWALLREVGQAEPLSGTLGAYIDVQLPTSVWLKVKAVLEEHNG